MRRRRCPSRSWSSAAVSRPSAIAVCSTRATPSRSASDARSFPGSNGSCGSSVTSTMVVRHRERCSRPTEHRRPDRTADSVSPTAGQRQGRRRPRRPHRRSRAHPRPRPGRAEPAGSARPDPAPGAAPPIPRRPGTSRCRLAATDRRTRACTTSVSPLRPARVYSRGGFVDQHLGAVGELVDDLGRDDRQHPGGQPRLGDQLPAEPGRLVVIDHPEPEPAGGQHLSVRAAGEHLDVLVLVEHGGQLRRATPGDARASGRMTASYRLTPGHVGQRPTVVRHRGEVGLQGAAAAPVSPAASARCSADFSLLSSTIAIRRAIPARIAPAYSALSAVELVPQRLDGQFADQRTPRTGRQVLGDRVHPEHLRAVRRRATGGLDGARARPRRPGW